MKTKIRDLKHAIEKNNIGVYTDCGNYIVYKNSDVLKIKTNTLAKKTLNIYLKVSINAKPVSIHRLMYYSFKGELTKGLVINHIDGNKLNNNIENLELITISENTKHSFHILGNNPGVLKRKLDEFSVLTCLTSGSFYRNKFSKHYNVTAATVVNIKNNRTYKNFYSTAKYLSHFNTRLQRKMNKYNKKYSYKYFLKREKEISYLTDNPKGSLTIFYGTNKQVTAWGI